MVSNNTPPKKPQKFFFDLNHFDDEAEDVVEETEDLPPPPPTFSEAELEAARKEAYDKGKRDGLAEAEASREKFVAGIFENISKGMATLFEAEEERSKRYEAEAVHLSRAIFRKLFPTLNARFGAEEVAAVITRVMERQEEQPQIMIEVHPDHVGEIETLLAARPHSFAARGSYTVTGNEKLDHGDCRIQWAAGGAHRRAGYLAEEIEKELDQVLADKPVLHDNGLSGDNEESSGKPSQEDAAPGGAAPETEIDDER